MSVTGASLRGRRVFLTGHTGFKGSWLLLWLQSLGADVTGYALAAEDPSMYAQLELDGSCKSIIGDVRDREHLMNALRASDPDVIFHLAAQPLVLASYDDPVGTLQTNVLGTANLLDAVRTLARPCVVIVVTSDKCYENREWNESYRESDPMGGHDLYSTSKAASELVAASYRRSFFGAGETIRVATVRAGNVIGGGDWAAGRIIPDCIRALSADAPIRLRNPRFVRPWQHVLEPLAGYLLLAEKLLAGETALCTAWNFGPRAEDARAVQELVEAVVAAWGRGSWISENSGQPHEAQTLRLCTDKAQAILGWRPRWSFAEGVEQTVAWYRAAHEKATGQDLRTLSLAQIQLREGVTTA